MPDEGGSSKDTLYCSFCGKSQHEVKKLIAGPLVFICNECVLLCFDIILDEKFSLEDALRELFVLRDSRPTQKVVVPEGIKQELAKIVADPLPP